MLKTIKTIPGSPSPLGFSIEGTKANVALFSIHAEQVTLVLFNGIKKREIQLKRDRDIWHIGLEGVPPKTEYAFKVKGPYAPEKGLLYKEDLFLADPYSKSPSSRPNWGQGLGSVQSYCVSSEPFDWQQVPSPLIAKRDLMIYEIHVRGFTQDPSSSTTHPGTFLAIIEKIPYLKKLGVNAVELMPVFEFDETHRKGLPNYWGYSPLYFFAPMRRFSANNPVIEFKTMVRELHRNGIEVLLDVVYNHTGESKDLNYYVNFRGIDNSTYYMTDLSGRYLDFSGCFNTFNVNHPAVTQLILDSLHYWVKEMRVDGFRFDLTSIFHRGCDGKPIESSPLLQAITSDPVLQNVKLIAEPWDAAGLYEPGAFAKLGNWSEWNGLFRDHARKFIKGTDQSAGKFAKVLTGSQFIYASTTPLSTINFITAHDGFTLRDLVSYQEKKNFDNEEMNKDGNDHNINWNCGAEGPTDDRSIQLLRERQMRNFFLSLFLAQGIPMLKMGDEYGHTSKGNNNPYVQDNRISWFLWDELEKNSSIFEFVSSLIAFRKKHADLFHSHFLTDKEIDWHGLEPFSPDWSDSSRFVAFTLKGAFPIYVAFNADHTTKIVHLPKNMIWREVIKTENPWDTHHLECPEKGALISSVELIPYSALVAREREAIPYSPGHRKLEQIEVKGHSEPKETSSSESLTSSLQTQVSEFKETIAQEQFTAVSESNGISMEENGRIIGSLFAHKTVDNLTNSFAQNPSLATELKDFGFNSQYPTPGWLQTYPESSTIMHHPSTDLAFSTDYTTSYAGNFGDLNAMSYQVRGDLALSSRCYAQAAQDFGNAISLDPSNPTLYLERGIANFELGNYEQSIADYNQFVEKKSEPFSVTDFSLGFAKGVPKGAYESGKGALLFLSDFVTHPVHTSKQIVDSIGQLATLVKNDEFGVVAETLSPELHQLLTQWDTLPSETKGELAGYAVGKLGTDLLAPGAVAKVASKSVNSAKELVAVCKNLQIAQEALVLETAAGIGIPVKVGEIVEKDFGLTEPQYLSLKKFRDNFRDFSDKYYHPYEFIDTPQWNEITQMAKEVLKAFNYKNEDIKHSNLSGNNSLRELSNPFARASMEVRDGFLSALSIPPM